MFNDVATLIAYTVTQDEVGNSVKVETRTDVFVQPRSIRMKEFYAAADVGIKADFVLVLADYYDYAYQRAVEYDGKVYDIVRTYRRENRLELTLTERLGHTAEDA